jgi:N-acetylglutamate synthase/N-acetylornithine aminotransferase
VRMFVSLARSLGRSVVTDAEEARKILGMKLTSSTVRASVRQVAA